MANLDVPNSTYLDLVGYRTTDKTSVVDAYGMPAGSYTELTGSDAVDLNVALVLGRNTEPTKLLEKDWAGRQEELAGLTKDQLWAKYGTDPAAFQTVEDAITKPTDKGGLGLPVLDDSNSNYVTSAASQTIWVELDTAADFQALFGSDVKLYRYTDPTDADNTFVFWDKNLELPTDWNVKGLWVDSELTPPATNMAGDKTTTLPQGAQSPGNDPAAPQPSFSPQAIADLYNFPLLNSGVATGPIGLIEPGIGDALPKDSSQTFQQLLTKYLASVGEVGTGDVTVQGRGGQEYGDDGGERSLDVGVVAAINPGSDIRLYDGSGGDGNADSTTYTALQSAVYEQGDVHPAVISDSWGDPQSMSPDSPFYYANEQLYVDAALANLTVFNAIGDGGSGYEIGNGIDNLEYNFTSQYAVVVGGTSISNFATAAGDPTLNGAVLGPALAGNASMIWQLVAGGLTSLPSNATALQRLVETVWNQYFVTGTTIGTNPASPDYGGYLVNTAGSGGVDPSQPAPLYQQEYGLNPVTSDPRADPGRGAPDVASDAGGDTSYIVPVSDMTTNHSDGGTSAASPLWASLAVQLNAIFDDQGLPNLGYMNDLLYIASVIAPAAFNDVTIGSNTSSVVVPGEGYTTINSDATEEVDVRPTGYGYSAAPGYDLVSGLGTPNGVLLARALTLIAHSQTSFADVPDVVNPDNSGGWTSGADQSLLFQTNSAAAVNVSLFTGSKTTSYTSAAASAFAWTSQFAEQSLQPDFDPALVLMFDKQAQGALSQYQVKAGDTIGVGIDGAAASAEQANLSTSFGFADFFSGAIGSSDNNTVNVARPVMVAETADGADDQDAVVRMRSDGQDSLSLEFYRVDDMNGKIDGLSPGDAGYAAKAAARAYNTTSGSPMINGPSYGNYGQTELTGVNAGDLVAMVLTNNTHGDTYWEFSQANETVNGAGVAHVWNYGANTFGWEDTRGGGDLDYNDLVVNVDFTSASGHGLLV